MFFYVEALILRAHDSGGVSPAERARHATHKHLVAAVTAEDVSTSVLIITLYVITATNPAGPCLVVIESVLDTTVFGLIKTIFLAHYCDGAPSHIRSNGASWFSWDV